MVDNALQGMDPSYQADWEIEQRKRMLAQALMAQAMKGPQLQQIGGQAARLSPLAALAPVLQGFLANRSDAEGAKNQREILGKSQAQTSQQLNDLYTGMSGEKPQQGPTMPGMPDLGNQPVDMKQLLASALSSTNPQVQAAAGGIRKQQIEQEAAAEKFRQERLVAAGKGAIDYGDPQGGAAMLRDNAIPQGYKPPAIPDPVPGSLTGPDGKSQNYFTTANRKGEKDIKFAPGGMQVSISQGATKAGLEKAYELSAGDIKILGEQARTAQGLKNSLQTLGGLAENGTYYGPLANGKTWLASLLNSANIPVDATKLGNSESYQAVAQDAVQKIIGASGGNKNVTKEEAALIAKIIPQLETSPQARTQLMEILNSKADMTISGYHAARKSFDESIEAQNPGKYDYTLGQPASPPPSAKAPVAMASSPSLSPERETERTRTLQEEYSKAVADGRTEDAAAVKREMERDKKKPMTKMGQKPAKPGWSYGGVVQ